LLVNEDFVLMTASGHLVRESTDALVQVARVRRQFEAPMAISGHCDV
jgi:hypothetical protein